VIGMNSRIKKLVWRQIAQSMGWLKYLICSTAKAYYLKNQGSSDRSSMTPRLAASLAKAKANQEIIRSFKRLSSFISPLLGPLCRYARVSFFGAAQALLRRFISPLTKHGVPYV